jgi:hypothetical protein
VAVLGRQQLAEGAGGAAQDDPAGLGLADGQQPQLAAAGPDGAGMLGRPGVAGAVAGGTAGQMPQDRGGAAGQAGDEAGEGGVHAGRAGQRPAHLGGPGQSRVAPVLGQIPEDVGDVGGGQLQPGVPEGEAGELAAGPHQGASAGGGAEP